MKKITEGKFIKRGYEYKGFEIRNHGHYPPENIKLKKEIKQLKSENEELKSHMLL